MARKIACTHHKPNAGAILPFFEGAASGNQDGQVSHIKKNRRQQLEETALARIDPRQRHRHQGHDEDQQRQRQTPLQFGTRTDVVTAQQGTSGHRIAIGDFVADVRLGQQYAVLLVFDGTVVGLTRITVVAVAVIEDQITVAVGANFLTAFLGHQYGNPAILFLSEFIFFSAK